MSGLNMLALDIGASSGRAIQGRFDGEKLALDEIYRFSNDPVHMGQHFVWDFWRLFHEVKTSIRQAGRQSSAPLSSVAIDTWGVDLGFVDRDGRLLGAPYHYRDERTEAIREKVYTLIPERSLYAATGNYPWSYNSIFQLYAFKLQQPALFRQAARGMFIPDLLNFYLTGERATEYTVASTSGLLDAQTGLWSGELFDLLSIPPTLFEEIRQPGSFLAPLSEKVCSELHVPPIPVMLTASHDSAAAVAAIPTSAEHYAYISCGTWSIAGVESDRPLNTSASLALSFTNEGGIGGRTRVIKNIMGLWLLQECRRQWAIEGEAPDHQTMQDWARGVSDNVSYIDPDHASFVLPLHMPRAIQAYCRETNQFVPRDKPEIVRCILESMALKYRQTLAELEQLVSYRIAVVHLVGGGVNNSLLCQLTADATGRPVIAGPVEATAIGNLLVQAMAHGEIATLSELRQVVRQSFSPCRYEPRNTDQWQTKYKQFSNLLTQALKDE